MQRRRLIAAEAYYAAVTIQRVWRGHTSRVCLWKYGAPAYVNAVIRIQCQWRIVLACRETVRRLESLVSISAHRLRSLFYVWKSHRLRSLIHAGFIRKAVIRIQSAYRKQKAIRLIKILRELRKQRMICLIQSIVRRYLSIKMTKQRKQILYNLSLNSLSHRQENQMLHELTSIQYDQYNLLSYHDFLFIAKLSSSESETSSSLSSSTSMAATVTSFSSFTSKTETIVSSSKERISSHLFILILNIFRKLMLHGNFMKSYRIDLPYLRCLLNYSVACGICSISTRDELLQLFTYLVCSTVWTRFGRGKQVNPSIIEKALGVISLRLERLRVVNDEAERRRQVLRKWHARVYRQYRQNAIQTSGNHKIGNSSQQIDEDVILSLQADAVASALEKFRDSRTTQIRVGLKSNRSQSHDSHDAHEISSDRLTSIPPTPSNGLVSPLGMQTPNNAAAGPRGFWRSETGLSTSSMDPTITTSKSTRNRVETDSTTNDEFDREVILNILRSTVEEPEDRFLALSRISLDGVSMDRLLEALFQLSSQPSNSHLRLFDAYLLKADWLLGATALYSGGRLLLPLTTAQVHHLPLFHNFEDSEAIANALSGSNTIDHAPEEFTHPSSDVPPNVSIPRASLIDAGVRSVGDEISVKENLNLEDGSIELTKQPKSRLGQILMRTVRLLDRAKSLVTVGSAEEAEFTARQELFISLNMPPQLIHSTSLKLSTAVNIFPWIRDLANSARIALENSPTNSQSKTGIPACGGVSPTLILAAEDAILCRGSTPIITLFTTIHVKVMLAGGVLYILGEIRQANALDILHDPPELPFQQKDEDEPYVEKLRINPDEGNNLIEEEDEDEDDAEQDVVAITARGLLAAQFVGQPFDLETLPLQLRTVASMRGRPPEQANLRPPVAVLRPLLMLPHEISSLLEAEDLHRQVPSASAPMEISRGTPSIPLSPPRSIPGTTSFNGPTLDHNIPGIRRLMKRFDADPQALLGYIYNHLELVLHTAAPILADSKNTNPPLSTTNSPISPPKVSCEEAFDPECCPEVEPLFGLRLPFLSNRRDDQVESNERRYAAITLQRIWRGYYARLRVQFVISTRRIIRRRRYLAQKVMYHWKRFHYRHQQAARTIQGLYLTKKLSFWHRVKRHCAVILQCRFRIFLSKKRFTELKERRAVGVHVEDMFVSGMSVLVSGFRLQVFIRRAGNNYAFEGRDLTRRCTYSGSVYEAELRSLIAEANQYALRQEHFAMNGYGPGSSQLGAFTRLQNGNGGNVMVAAHSSRVPVIGAQRIRELTIQLWQHDRVAYWLATHLQLVSVPAQAAGAGGKTVTNGTLSLVARVEPFQTDVPKRAQAVTSHPSLPLNHPFAATVSRQLRADMETSKKAQLYNRSRSTGTLPPSK